MLGALGEDAGATEDVADDDDDEEEENYYLIILQYKHTYNNNKAQLLIFIKDIMYYTMDPSCAKPGTKMDT
jgi:hypothetical protein